MSIPTISLATAADLLSWLCGDLLTFWWLDSNVFKPLFMGHWQHYGLDKLQAEWTLDDMYIMTHYTVTLTS